MEQLPYPTRNTALAVVAFLFRIPVTRKRVYTEEMLKSKGITAKEANRRGILGQVDYFIHTDKDEDFPKIVKAFNDEKLRIEDGQDECPLEVDPEVAARIACRVLYARKNFFRDLFELVPFIRILKGGSPVKSKSGVDGSFTVKTPGFTDVRMDADEATLKHLGL